MSPIGWRTLITNLAIIGCVTYVAIATQSVELVTAIGVIFVSLSGANLWGKKVAGEQAIKKNGVPP